MEEAKSYEELLEEIKQERKKCKKNIKMGNWVFRPRNLTLSNAKASYEVNLEVMTDSAKTLDWIFQIEEKSNPKLMDLENFVRLLSIAIWCNFYNTSQGVFCPGGLSMEVDWKKKEYTRKF
jgi:hypothetical protein